jgi:lipopolysaccharide export system permease protein
MHVKSLHGFRVDNEGAAGMQAEAMRIFDRYLAKQILVSTLMAVVMLSVVLVLGQIFKKLLDGLVAGILPPSAVFKFMGYAFPMSLSYTVPWGLLTAVLLTFGRLSADNELVSMRMAGLSLRRICLPVFVVAGVLSALCFWINTTVAPYSYTETQRMTKQALIRDPRILFQPDKTVDQLPGHLIYVADRQGDELKNVQIVRLQDDGDKGRRGRPAGMIFAREGRLRVEGMEQHHSIEFGATDNTYFVRDELPPLNNEQRSRMTPEQIAAYEARIAAQAKEPPRIFDFGTRLSEIPIGMKSLFDKAAAVRVDGLSMEEIRQGLKSPDALQITHPGVRVPTATEMRTEWHRRLSFSLACFVLALAGISFGITAQRRETSSGFVLSLVVGIGYFSLIMLGSIWSSKPEYKPHLWVWLPNVVFGILGVVMFRRLQRK